MNFLQFTVPGVTSWATQQVGQPIIEGAGTAVKSTHLLSRCLVEDLGRQKRET